jgi:hypothetical protein
MLREFKVGCKVKVIYMLYIDTKGQKIVEEFDTLEETKEYLRTTKIDVEQYRIEKRTIIDEFEKEELIHL